jgi:predicted molibdopterin-dependent oxidoreductase YjgC
MPGQAGMRPETPHLVMDGRELDLQPGETIWQCARRHGIEIPQLCLSTAPDFRPAGNCRIGLVEVAGFARLQPGERPRAQFRETTWAEALDRAALGFLRIKQQQGRAAMGGFGTAKGSNEEGYLFQKLVRTGFGCNNVDHCARLCRSSSVVALMDQLGSGVVTAAFARIEHAEVALVVGLNPSRGFPVAGAIMRRAAPPARHDLPGPGPLPRHHRRRAHHPCLLRAARRHAPVRLARHRPAPA